MTQQKDLKRLVRARMQKTGESYTSARAVLVNRQNGLAKTAGVQAHAQWAKLAGMSDNAVHAKTGRTWPEWVAALDKAGAQKLPHKDIAIMLHDKFGVGDWWAQMVTVGYERIRGLREKGQRRDGAYEASKSRTFSASVRDLYAMFSPKKIRSWLPEGIAKHRGGTANKTINLDWKDGTKAGFWFVSKGADKCSVAVQHTKLKAKDDIARRKAFWTERFEALSAALK